jgi:hypothetical protein
MRLVYLAANMAWVVMFGDSIIGITDRYDWTEYSWQSRRDAVAHLANCRGGGLSVSRAGIIS